MTINLAWKHSGVAYLVADSIQSRAAVATNIEPTTLGERGRIGGETRTESAPKVVALSATLLVSFRGYTAQALDFLKELRKRETPDANMQELLRDTFNWLAPSDPFGLHVARQGPYGVELWSFSSSSPAEAVIIEDLSTEPVPANLAKHVLVHGSALDGDGIDAVRAIAALAGLPQVSPEWTAACAASWVMAWAHYYGMIDHGVGGHVVGAAMTESGIRWMADTRMFFLPGDAQEQLLSGVGQGPPPVQSPFLEGFTRADVAIRDGFPIVFSNALEPDIGQISEPFLSRQPFEKWRRKWNPRRLRMEWKTLNPQLWTFGIKTRRNVVFVTPRLCRETHVRVVKRPGESAIWLSQRLRDRLFAPSDGTNGSVCWFPDLEDLLGQ